MVEGGSFSFQRVSGQKTLSWRTQDEGGVETGGGTEVEVLAEPRKRKGGDGAPTRRGLSHCGANTGDGYVVFVQTLEWRTEKAGPPSAVGRQIKLEIAIRNWIGEEKLGHIIPPQFCLKASA